MSKYSIGEAIQDEIDEQLRDFDFSEIISDEIEKSGLEDKISDLHDEVEELTKHEWKKEFLKLLDDNEFLEKLTIKLFETNNE